jgi:predicted secreted protein
MAARAARNLVLTVNTTAIASIRVIGIKMDSEFIDVTSADSDGVRKILAGAPAGVSCTITVSGVSDSNVLRAIALDPATDRLLTGVTLNDPGAPTGTDLITCDFFMTSFENNGEYKDAVMFSATLESSGAWAAT